MTIKAWLEGHQFDLAYLAQLLPAGNIRVVQEGDRYYLTSPEIDNPAAGTHFHDVAERIITHVNGLGLASHSAFRPVSLSRIYNDEKGITVVPETAHLEARGALSATVTATDASGNAVSPEPSPGPDLIALADSNPDVAEVLEILGESQRGWAGLGWGDLFKIHEKIQESISGAIPNMGWASGADDDAFGASANRRDISGRDARHSRTEKRPPPKRTMTIHQGRQYIRDIVAKWLDHLR